MKIVIAYVPVLYSGYEAFFRRHADADKLLILGKSTVESFPWLKKDLRCLSPMRVLEAIQSWKIFPAVELFEETNLESLRCCKLVMPDETESHLLAETILLGMQIIFERIDLRYDKKKVESVSAVGAPITYDREVQKIMGIALNQADLSNDWWLRVGAIVARNNECLIVAHNIHFPSDRELVFMGDPRSNYSRGINIELTSADHAERAIIARAARRGIPLEGCDMYVTKFPCPPCAAQVAHTGVKRLFFKDGYSILDGADKMRSEGIEIFQVSG